MNKFTGGLLIVSWLGIFGDPARADPFLAPGDVRLRHDLAWLNDSRSINVPTNMWPLSWGDILRATNNIDVSTLSPAAADALRRVRSEARSSTSVGEFNIEFGISIADSPRHIRTFGNTPRNDANLVAGLTWTGEVFALNLQAALVDDSTDGDNLYPDGSYVGMALGNWMLSAGWQERWWGPGHDGSLILSNNARPSPGIAVQRNRTTAFESTWLSWIGPWSLTGFMDLLDDDREVDNALLFGLRYSFKPIASLEIGLSRTAQWCGRQRPCDFKAFGNMLLGKDNRGVNVNVDEEPGNQLAGFDMHWSLPFEIPVAIYAQWIGEDGRDAKAIPGSWLRQWGLEFWGNIGDSSYRTHIEVSDTTCHEGGLGFADIKPDCAYEHTIYRTGYRYKQKSVGHGIDGDGLSYSIGSILVRPDGQSWNILLRYMEINRNGTQGPRHTLSATAQDLADFQLTHERVISSGRLCFGFGYSRLHDLASGTNSSDVSAFIRYNTR